MKKTIILSENQLKYLTEFNNYLGDESDSNENGAGETSSDGKKTDGDNGEPTKTQDIARKLAPNNRLAGSPAVLRSDSGYGGGHMRENVDSKKKTLSESIGDKKGEAGGNKTAKNMNFVIPGKLFDELKCRYSAYSGDENTEGYKRLQFIIDSEGNLKYGEMIRLKNYFQTKINLDTTSGEMAYNLLCGDKLKKWINASLNNVSKLNKINNA